MIFRRPWLRAAIDRAAAHGKTVCEADEKTAQRRRRDAQAPREGTLDIAAPTLRRL